MPSDYMLTSLMKLVHTREWKTNDHTMKPAASIAVIVKPAASIAVIVKSAASIAVIAKSSSDVWMNSPCTAIKSIHHTPTCVELFVHRSKYMKPIHGVVMNYTHTLHDFAITAI